jgi:hypothetical protein
VAVSADFGVTWSVSFVCRWAFDSGMNLRHTTRKKDGKTHRHWRLVRSVRVGRGVIQLTVAQLGEEHGRLEARALARHLIGELQQARLFDDVSEQLTVRVRL